MPAKAKALEFLRQLEELKVAKGLNLTIHDIDQLFCRLHGESNSALVCGIENIAGKINDVKVEITQEQREKAGTALPGANLELEEVLAHTEEAANSIMESAEAIQAIANDQDEVTAHKLFDEVTKIFEASSFQDITGQRIRKVIRTLIEIDGIVKGLLDAISGKVAVLPTVKKEANPEDFEKSLMNGPQLKKDTPSQDDIDRLFAES